MENLDAQATCHNEKSQSIPSAFPIRVLRMSGHAIQRERILALLRSARGAWIPLLDILALDIAQYNARIFELRKRGLSIENRIKTINGVRHSWFRLVDSPASETPKPQAPKRGPEWKDRPRLTGLPLFDLAVRS
jgi:hypothetical protein